MFAGCAEPAEPAAETEADIMAAVPTGPTAVLVVIDNGTEVFASDAEVAVDAAVDDEEDGNGTAADENATAAPDDAAAGDGNASVTQDNGTLNATAPAADVMAAPGLNLTFDASRSLGENLTFAWTIGEGENATTATSAEVVHAFAEAGTYAVALTVTDAAGLTDEASATVLVETAGPAPGTVLREAPETFAGGQVAGGSPECSLSTNLNEKSFTWTLVDTEEDGTPSVVTKISITGTNGAAGLGRRITLRDPAGEVLGQGTSIALEGAFGPGAYTITWRLCGGFSTTSNAVATATYAARAS